MPQRNSNQLSVDQIQTILENDRIRQHLVRAGYIDHRGNVIPVTNGAHQSSRPNTARTSNDRTRSPDSQSSDRRRRNQSRKTNKSPVSARVQTVLLRRAVSPEILPADEQCLVTLQYYGLDLNIEYDRDYFEPQGDEVVIMQQHCGGENHLAFRGFLQPDEVFSFKSRRHMNYPFAFSFYWNGVMKDRLSICCEYRSIKTMRVGGQGCLVAIIKVENARACRRCRYEQRMKQLLERYPKIPRAVPRRQKSKSPSRLLKDNQKDSNRSSSESLDAPKKKPRGLSARRSSSDSSNPDTKPSHQRTPKPDTNGDRSTSPKDTDFEPRISHRRSPDTSKSTSTKPRSPSPQPIASDVSDAEPTISHKRSSSPQPVESVSSSPEPPVFAAIPSSTNKKGLPTPQTIDSDSSDSEPKPRSGKPPAIDQVDSDPSSPPPSNTKGFRLSKPKTPSPINTLPSNEANREIQSPKSSDMYDADSEKSKHTPHPTFSHNDINREHKESSSSDSSEDNRRGRRPVAPFVPKRFVPNEVDTSSDDSESNIRRHPTRMNLQPDADDD